MTEATGADLIDSSQQATPRPPTVTWAIRLMYITAALLIIALIINLVIALPHPAPFGLKMSPAAYVVNTAFPPVLYAAGWLWMAWKNSRGRGWARILATVFFALFCAVFAYEFALHAALQFSGGGLGPYPGILAWLLILAAIVLIWHPKSAPFYQRHSPGRTSPDANPAGSEPRAHSPGSPRSSRS